MQGLFSVVLLALVLITERAHSREVCYTHDNYIHDLGCFSDDYPFKGQHALCLPKHPNVLPITFFVHTPSDPTQIITPATYDNLTDFASNTTFFIIHGWKGIGEDDWNRELREELFLLDPYINVVNVDWAPGANAYFPQAAANSRLAGAQLGHLIAFLVEDFGLDPSLVHIAGHSLGAQVAGFAGEWVQKLEEKPFIIGRITALDAAKPSFDVDDPRLRVDRSDADFVDAIHSNAHQTMYLGLGLPHALGHMDFFPDGGYMMPGCYFLGFIPSDEEEFSWFTESAFCSHMRARWYFVASVRKCRFRGYRVEDRKTLGSSSPDRSCEADDSCPLMGLGSREYLSKIDKNIDNVYWVDVTGKKPFCEGAVVEVTSN